MPRLLHQLGYSLRANAKVGEGAQHPDRDSQFNYLNEMAAGFIADGQPVISTGTKEKELIGDYKNGARSGRPAASPTASRSTTSPPGHWGNGAKLSPTASTTW